MAEQIHHFELERSTDGSNWTMLNAAIPPADRSYDDTETPPVGSSFYYRLTGKTVPSNMDIPYNIVSLENPGVDPGKCLLARHFGQTTVTGVCVPRRIRVDSSGSVLVCGFQTMTANYGSGNTTSAGGQDCFVAKYSQDGTLQWFKRWGQNSNDIAWDCCFDSAGNILVIGSLSGSLTPGTQQDFGFGPVTVNGGSEVFLLKLTSTGNLVFFKVWGGDGGDIGKAVAVDSSNNIYITGIHGFFGSGINFGAGQIPSVGRGSVFVVKFNPNADTVLWQKGWGGPDGESGRLMGLEVNSTGVFMTGTFNGTVDYGSGSMTWDGDVDSYIAKYSLTDGSAIWVKQLTGGSVHTQLSRAIALDPSGNVLVAGQFFRTLNVPGGPNLSNGTEGTLFVLKFDTDGNFVWQRNWDANYNAPTMFGVTCDNQGNVTICGEMITGIDFGTGFLLGQGGNDLFLVKMDPNGVVQWARRGRPTGDAAVSVAAHPLTRQLLVAGTCGAYPVLLNVDAQEVILIQGTTNQAFWTRWTP